MDASPAPASNDSGAEWSFDMQHVHHSEDSATNHSNCMGKTSYMGNATESNITYRGIYKTLLKVIVEGRRPIMTSAVKSIAQDTCNVYLSS